MEKISLAVLFFLFLAGGLCQADTGYDFFIEVDFDDAILYLSNGTAKVVASYPVALPNFKLRRILIGDVDSIVVKPWWGPTKSTREAYFKKHGTILPERIAPGNEQNAMGAAKIIIKFNDPTVNLPFRIHGNNDESSIGRRISRGCIRMYNEHIMDLVGIIRGKKTKVIIGA